MTSYMPVPAPVGVDAAVVDCAYQGPSNQMRQAAAVIASVPMKISLANKGLGQSQLVQLPQGPLLGVTVLTLKFARAAIPAGAVLESGWAYRALQQYEITVGDSTQNVIRDNLLLKNLMDAEDRQKRQDIHDYGGAQVVGPNTDAEVIGYVCLYSPFSNMAAARCIPFDSSCVSRPITINLTFAGANQLFTTVNATVPLNLPGAFSDAYVTQKVFNFVDQANSIRTLVGPAGNREYTYGWNYPLQWRAPAEVGSFPASAPGGAKATVRMDGFQNGSILSIQLYLTLETLTRTDTAAASITYPYASVANNDHWYHELSNVVVSYGGQDVWRSDDQTGNMLGLSEFPADDSFATTIQTGKQGSGSMTSTSAQSRFYNIQLSQWNERFHSSLVQHAPSIVNQTVQVVFNTPELSSLTARVPVPATFLGTETQPVTAATWILHANILYAGGVRVAKGMASMIYVQPSPMLAGSLMGASAFAGAGPGPYAGY